MRKRARNYKIFKLAFWRLGDDACRGISIFTIWDRVQMFMRLTLLPKVKKLLNWLRDNF